MFVTSSRAREATVTIAGRAWEWRLQRGEERTYKRSESHTWKALGGDARNGHILIFIRQQHSKEKCESG